MERILQSPQATYSLTRLLTFCYHLPHEHDATLRAATPGTVAVAVITSAVVSEYARRGSGVTQVA